MLIGIDAHHANKLAKTGTEWYAHDLLRTLPHVDTEDTLRLYTPSPIDLGLLAFARNTENAVLRWPPKRLWTQIRLSSEMLMRPPDALFVPAHAIPFVHPKNTVTTIHDIGFVRSPKLYSRFERFYNLATTAFALRTAKKIIVPSEFTKQEILQCYPSANPEKLVVIHHGFTRDRFAAEVQKTAIDAVKQRNGIQRPYVLYIGRLQYKKNIPRLVKAFAIAVNSFGMDLDLVLAGKPDFGFEEAQRRIQQHALQERIRILGYISDQERTVLLHGAVAFTFPSLYEGFGFPILEAQASGVPVLTSATASLPEIAGNGALFVNPLIETAIAEGIRSIVTDEKLRNTLRAAGTANLDRFRWEDCARATLGVIHQ